MATNTYVALAKVTASGSSTTQLVMSSIPNTYTDLIIVGNIPTSMVGVNGYLQFNGDTGSNYSWTRILGDGSSASSSRGTSQTGINYLVNDYTTTICHIQNYSNTTTYKTALVRANNPSDYVTAAVGLWRNTTAITSVTIDLDGNTIPSGSTFSLYGIAAEGTSPAPKATGGAIYSDSTYYYHVFGSTGTFTPLSSLTADVLVVAGGGGGGDIVGGGGGAGGLLGFNAQSLTATNYAVTVGAGGAAGSGYGSGTGGLGGDSQFGALTLVKGGGGGGNYNNSGSGITGATGGSGGGGGGGAGGTGAGGSATSGQGFAGGIGLNVFAGGYGGGGGGGAGAVGSNAFASDRGGAGGVGSTAYTSWGSATGAGQLVTSTYYFAGGGGGGGTTLNALGGSGGGGIGGSNSPASAATRGLANTGGGGGGTRDTAPAGTGGSGIVIVRYAKV